MSIGMSAMTESFVASITDTLSELRLATYAIGRACAGNAASSSRAEVCGSKSMDRAALVSGRLMEAPSLPH